MDFYTCLTSKYSMLSVLLIQMYILVFTHEHTKKSMCVKKIHIVTMAFHSFINMIITGLENL